MITRTPTGEATFEDFTALVHDGQKADLINGVIYMASPESVEHNDLVSWFDGVLRVFLEDRRLGRVTVNRVAYRLTERDAPEPDIAIVRAERQAIMKSGHVAGAPDLAIEIVSPDSIHRDYEEKRRQYDEAGVKEYWIIDPLDCSATFMVRGPSGLVGVHIENNIFRSQAVPGFWIDVRWLWERPLPFVLPTIQTILKGV